MATKKAAQPKNPSIPVGEFVLEYKPKYERAINELKKQGNYEPTELDVLAQYDRIAGRITFQGDTVVLGSFWDFEKNVAKATPTPKVVKRREVVEEEIVMEVPMKKEKTKKED